MLDGYQRIERPATVEEIRKLCTAVGWEEVMNFEAAQDGLPRSHFAVVVAYAGEVVGMRCVVGDGAGAGVFFSCASCPP